jgi:hypothetical protein
LPPMRRDWPEGTAGVPARALHFSGNENRPRDIALQSQNPTIIAVDDQSGQGG